MSTGELLYPRYKVTAPWPGMEVEPFRLQQIVTLQPSDDGFIHIPIKHIPGSYMRQGFFDKFPHLFQPLPWWSDREISDMPAYVKVIREDCIKDTGLYCKVYKWSPLGDKWPEMKGQVGAELEGYSPLYLTRTELNFPGQVYGRLNATHLLPATLQDYEQYNQQKEGKK